MAVSSTQDVAIGLPLIVSLIMIVGTIVIHAIALIGIVYFIRREHRGGHTGVRFWKDVAIVCTATLLTGAAHLLEITMWALLFVFCGEFVRFDAAFYHSAMNYTTLGYGDVIMSSSWKMLGPIEAADGLLMFSISTAIIIALIQMMVRTKFRDLQGF